MLFLNNKYICFNCVAVRIKFGQKLDSQSWRTSPFWEQNWIRQSKTPNKNIFILKNKQKLNNLIDTSVQRPIPLKSTDVGCPTRLISTSQNSFLPVTADAENRLPLRAIPARSTYQACGLVTCVITTNAAPKAIEAGIILLVMDLYQTKQFATSLEDLVNPFSKQ